MEKYLFIHILNKIHVLENFLIVIVKIFYIKTLSL